MTLEYYCDTLKHTLTEWEGVRTQMITWNGNWIFAFFGMTNDTQVLDCFEIPTHGQ